jgi:hypothetical protein
MYLCILDQAGNIVLHHEVPAEPGTFLEAIAPYRDGLVVACECLFCWYWLADLCARERVVQSARGVDARFLNESLAPVSRASSSNEHEKNWIIQSPSGVRPLDFRDL